VTIADLKLDWSKCDGLLPAIVQHAKTGAVLMLGYMNPEALAKTLDSGRVTFFSRSRRALWTKGETSGHFLSVAYVSADCDGDALLVQAIPAGPVCHAGTPGCFPASLRSEAERLEFLATLENVIADRIASKPDSSYTARLHGQGLRRVAQKVGEEGLELALAAAGGNGQSVIDEAADLVYHVLLALHSRGQSLAAVVTELEQRHAASRKSPIF
jgi:phosphoribosyl-ATP pyrophosphohydrolase/phosphoribosyl-AMP cyclohydrolase